MGTLGEAAHTSWLACSREPWFTPSLAEDWVRLAILAPIAHAPLQSVTLHSFGPTEEAIRTHIPTYAALLPLIIGQSDQETLQARLSNLLLPLEVPIDLPTFWRFVTRFILSIAIPGTARKGSISALLGGSRGKRALLPYYDADSGLGLKLVPVGTEGTALPLLWGECFPVRRVDVVLLVSIARASSLSFVTGDDFDVHHITMGPIALLNQACEAHCNITPLSGPRSQSSPLTGLAPEDWTGGTLCSDVKAGERLYVSYGSSYTDDGKEPELECPECPWRYNSTSKVAHSAWLSLVKAPWMSLALAEDWVTVSTLCPLAGVPADQALTHSIGLTRARLIAKRPLLSEIVPLLSTRRELAVAAGLRAAYGNPLAALGEPNETWHRAFDALNLDSFWKHATRFLLALAIPPSTRAGLVPVFTDGQLTLAYNKELPGGSAVPGCWGVPLLCPERTLATVERVDNRTSRTLMSSGNKSFVVLGPLSFLPHACSAHAVVRPELSCLVSAKRDKATGLSPADYSGCTTIAPYLPNQALCFSHALGAGAGGADTANLSCTWCVSDPAPSPTHSLRSSREEEERITSEEESESSSSSSPEREAPVPPPPPPPTPQPAPPLAEWHFTTTQTPPPPCPNWHRRLRSSRPSWLGCEWDRAS